MSYLPVIGIAKRLRAHYCLIKNAFGHYYDEKSTHYHRYYRFGI